jgi:hypothetical protein
MRTSLESEGFDLPPRLAQTQKLDWGEAPGMELTRRSPFGALVIFNAMLRNLLDSEKSRKEYNQSRPYSSLRYRPPTPETLLPLLNTGNSSLGSGTIIGGRSLHYRLGKRD